MNDDIGSTAPGAQGKTFDAPLWVLVLLQTFTIWQMGIVYYSSRFFTVSGAADVPASAMATALSVAAGYLTGAALCWLAPQRIGLWARAIAGLTLISVVLSCLTLPAELLAALYYAEIFLCVCFVGVSGALVIDLYSLKTALLDGLVATLLSAPFTALIHLDAFNLELRTFNIISAVIQCTILGGLTRIPTRAGIRFLPRRSRAPKGEGRQPPMALLGASVFVYTLVCLCCLFSSSAAESVPNGISLFYIAGGCWAALFAFLHYRKKAKPFRLYTAFMGIAALGFVLWLLPVAQFRPVSIVLQGAGVCLANLAWFIMGVLFEKWRSRSVAPMAIIIAFAAALLHSLLLEVMRRDTALLYSLYAVIALAMQVVYFITEPYFNWVWIDSLPVRPKAATHDSAAAPSKAPAPAGSEALPLTKREKELLPLLVQGYDNASIAKMLFISEHTVKTHVKNIFQKMDVHSRFALAAKVNRLDEGRRS